MADVVRQAKNLKLKYLKSRQLTSDLFNQVIDLILLVQGENSITSETLTGEEIRDKLQTLVGPNRLRAANIADLDIEAGVGKMSAIEIRNAIQSLSGDAKLSATALSELTSNNVLFAIEGIPDVKNVQDVILYILNEITKYEPYLGIPDEDGQVLTSTVEGIRSWTTIETDKNWTYIRIEALPVWEFDHPLKKKPAITILNEDGKEIKAGIEYIGNTGIRITFNHPQIGSAELN